MKKFSNKQLLKSQKDRINVKKEEIKFVNKKDLNKLGIKLLEVDEEE